MSRKPMPPVPDRLPIDVPKPPRPKTSTAVYQGVCAQIRALFPTNTPKRRTVDDETDQENRTQLARHAGIIAQARSLAASIDRVAGDNGYQASGMQLSAMHAELRELLSRLDPTTADATDPFMRWLQSDDADAPPETLPALLEQDSGTS